MLKKNYYKIFLFLFIILSIYLSIGIINFFYTTRNPFTIGDWLINYQGGFVRRGFLGELFLIISKLLNINIGKTVRVFLILTYTIYLILGFFISINNRYYNFLLMTFSPVLYYFQILDPQGGYRKEIILLLSLSILTFIYLYFKKYFKFTGKIILILYPFLILIHEMLFGYFFYIYILLKTKNFMHNNNNKKIYYISLFLSSIFFILVVINSGSNYQKEKIYNSLSNLNYSIKNGAIDFIGKDIYYSLNFVRSHIDHNNYIFFYFIYTIVILISFIPCLLSIKKSIFKYFQDTSITFSILLIIIWNLILFLIAADWGRILYINYSIMYFLLVSIFYKLKKIKSNFLIICLILLSIIYFSNWILAHYQPNSNHFSYNFNNIKIIKNIIDMILN